MFKCNSQTLVREDYAAMKRKATKAAAGHVLDWKDTSTCSQTRHAHVWINGKPEPQPDGTKHDPSVLCERERGPWTCDLNVQRWYEFSVPILGREQKFALQLPMQLGTGEARAFAAQAFEKGTTLSVLDACDRRTDEARTSRDDELERDLRAEFTLTGEMRGGSIGIYEGSWSLDMGSFTLLFSRASPADPWVFKCWAFPIVVT